MCFFERSVRMKPVLINMQLLVLQISAFKNQVEKSILNVNLWCLKLLLALKCFKYPASQLYGKIGVCQGNFQLASPSFSLLVFIQIIVPSNNCFQWKEGQSKLKIFFNKLKPFTIYIEYSTLLLIGNTVWSLLTCWI